MVIKISEDTAEVSLIVFDEYKGMGIAKNIILRLADAARHNGIKYFEFHVLIDNVPMRKLLKSFTIEEKSGVNAFGKIIMTL